MKKKVIVIVGPTAVGKTELSINIAKRINGAIISGDSMQVYKGMDVGTAKVTEEEMQGIPHYMIDIKEPHESFSVADFKQYVQTYIDQITLNGQIPIIVGGSGLYIQAALYNYNFAESRRDEAFTKKLEELIDSKGIEPLYKRLMQIDPEQAKRIHPNNHRRVVRALEIYEITGKTMTELEAEQSHEALYDPIFIGLEMDRPLLYKRINDRVDRMLEDGLLEEVRDVYQKGLKDAQAMKAIGYKEFIPYFEGKQSLERSIELLKRNSRRFAKRQYTWFKNKLDIDWYRVHPDTAGDDYQIILNHLAGILSQRVELDT